MITMNKKGHKNQAERSSRRLWITLLFFCFTVTGFMQAANAVFAQTTVTATFKNATLSEVLWEVQRQTDFTFVYSTEEVKNVKVSVSVSGSAQVNGEHHKPLRHFLQY